ncbi:TlpA disulfide reductase family protein [Allomuricauda sp. SCSIO 65647]|uniref:TlpA disulfide reductase family protein n=1 Tax=Allomuricauda sp. SCSIO 65647 TaxID=2908843 RepID=UPI001F443B42|nr:TlpA disulfide reductase family protein [Muricauda sp. SCSIO 65647]UJH67427.1 AhpC/TSA family protein [Muricauda sp. SCSIO 65647]
MKKTVFALSITLLFIACNIEKTGYALKATVDGEVEDSTKVYLRTTDSLNQLVEIDTAQITEGSFEFEGNQEIPQLHYIFIEGLMGNVPVILENGSISVKFQRDSLSFAKVGGTPQNEFFADFMEGSRSFIEMGRSFNDDMRKAAAARDTAMIESLREESLELQEKMKNFNIDFIKENPNALVSALILENLMRTRILQTKEVDSLFQNFTPEIKATKPGKNLEKQLERTKATDIGEVAPDFSGPTPDGTVLALNEVTVKGKVTLIDFWAAWCRPCRVENPNIVNVYNKYKDKGLNIVGVSLDAREEQWKQAIAQDGLEWHHVSHLKRFQDPVAQLYNVNAIPAAFLLDENGVIVAKNLRGPALEKKVAELLN